MGTSSSVRFAPTALFAIALSSSRLKKAAPVKPPPPTRAGAAFAKIEPELATLDSAELAVINIDIANDLVALSALFTINWVTVSGKTAATLQEVKRAGELGPLLLAALGVREHGAAPGLR